MTRRTYSVVVVYELGQQPVDAGLLLQTGGAPLAGRQTEHVRPEDDAERVGRNVRSAADNTNIVLVMQGCIRLTFLVSRFKMNFSKTESTQALTQNTF